MPAKPNALPTIVTLTTDFGLADAYVASMKAAILRQCPHTLLIDVTHLTAPGDVLCASISLERAIDGFWPGSIHLAVVDPGVGSKRRILVVELADRLIVCPDNGLITWPWRRLGPGKAHELTWRPKHVSPTFHGRDIMGPTAGMLAAGRAVRKIAKPINDPILLDITPAKSPVKKGRIIHIDRFGNATTNIAFETIGSKRQRSIRVAGHRLGKWMRTYRDVAPGEPLALFGSSGLLEIAVRDGSAAQLLSLRVGDAVALEP